MPLVIKKNEIFGTLNNSEDRCGEDMGHLDLYWPPSKLIEGKG